MRQVDAQKRIDAAFVREGNGQGRRMRCRFQCRLNVGVVRLDMGGKIQVGGGVFVRRVEQGVFRQAVEALEAVVKLFDCAGEHASAACGKQGVAAENVYAV